ncbi:MAG: glucose dehydrogenase [Rhodothermaceae bacterium]|nr:MAG: glucose dehydrogenase [Rhodothermaceae bacterium]
MKPLSLLLLVASVLVAGCTQPESSPGATQAAACEPLETAPREAPGRDPAFPGQTRACGVTSDVAFDVVVLTTALERPWAVEPLPDGALLVTEKPGRMRVVSAGGEVGPPLDGVPAVDDRGQGGLLDVALSPDFATDRTIFWSYTEPREGGNGTSIARGVLSADRRRLENVRVILRTQPTYDNNFHYGSRIVFAGDGTLFVTVGERADTLMRIHAQRLDSHLGKVLRIRPDGSPAPDNPFVGREDALPEIWSYGHRNPQAAALDAQGRLWVIEHGPRGGDELNLVEKGKNYGWPLITYGIDYRGGPITYAGGPAEGAGTQGDGLEQPVYFWDPVIAPSGAQFYDGAAFPAWQGSLFIGALRGMRLVRLVIEDDRVTGEEHLLTDRNQRIRDVRQGPDGRLYLVTDEGQLLKLTPRG